jgi:hypothetical protein
LFGQVQALVGGHDSFSAVSRFHQARSKLYAHGKPIEQ